MPRLLLASLACAALSALSCAVLPATAPVASAPPPALETSAAPSSPAADPFVATAHGVLSAHRTGLAEDEIAELAVAIVREARRHELDPALVLAVMDVESNFDSFALSPVGAMGLMQVMPATGEELAAKAGIAWYGPQTLFDPFVNVRLGVAYLRELSDRYGNLAATLAAYNWGPGHIDRRLRRGTPLPVSYPRLVFEAYGSGRRRS